MTPFTDIGVAKNCKNPDSYGEICVKCNKCGRYNEPSEENLKMWREIFEEERRRKEQNETTIRERFEKGDRRTDRGIHKGD